MVAVPSQKILWVSIHGLHNSYAQPTVEYRQDTINQTSVAESSSCICLDAFKHTMQREKV